MYNYKQIFSIGDIDFNTAIKDLEEIDLDDDDDDEVEEDLNCVLLLDDPDRTRLRQDLFLSLKNQIKACNHQQLDFLLKAMYKLMYKQQFLSVLEGAAGTGKTFCLKLLKDLLEIYGIKGAFLSPTGAAAKEVQGQTLHSFFGFEVSDNLVNLGIQSKFKQERLKNKLLGVKILIIDEMSRILPMTLQAIDERLRFLDKKLPFGGMSILLTGDLLQFGPVCKYQKQSLIDNVVDTSSTGFNFSRKLISLFDFYEFKKIIRQNDSLFIDILNRIRFHKHTTRDIDLLNRYIPTVATPDLDHKIVCMNNDRVAYWNRYQSDVELNNLQCRGHDATFKHVSSYDIISHSYCDNLTEEEHQSMLDKLRKLPTSKTSGIAASLTLGTISK